ncbi:MAG TPA: alpha/beta fold hydrolase [Sandaracinaceae bacterium LLY-WYZ-13_1]|nr:alpha/beta fold hydrolase [Sandaracinaceae bacterium LLY-WYZ-13_1]
MTVTFEAAPSLPGWLRDRLPFERRAARIDGERTTFVDHGPRDGTPVLLVHGNPTWSFLWRKVIARLDGAPLRLVAPDLLGFGTSSKPRRASDHQLAMHVEHLALLVDALGLEGFVAVGQDWGGPIATGTAERLSDRVGGLVLGNTAVLRPARPFRPKAFHRFSHLPVVSDAVFRGLLFPVPVMDRVQGDRGSMGWLEKAAYAWPFLSPLDRAGPVGLARMVPNDEAHPSTSVMDRIGAWVEGFEGPAALVWAHRDPILGRGLRRHREVLPQASVRESDAGHFSQEEIPELWAEAIREVAAAV